jgi:hypothetical protein
MIKSFRGLLGDGKEQRVRLSTKKGKIGYRIVKFELFPNQMGVAVDSLVKVFKIPQVGAGIATSGTVDMSDHNLLAVGANYNATYEIDHILIFDREIFNQDIYINHHESTGTASVNYYLELETMTLSDNAASVSTLRDIRLNPQVGA